MTILIKGMEILDNDCEIVSQIQLDKTGSNTARDITMKVMFSEYSPPDYPEFVSVANPRRGWEYYFLDDNRGMIKVRVKSGQLFGEHGLSNFWRWVELDTDKEISGYGNFFKRRRTANDHTD